jgi:hypothetical protein
MIVAARLLLVPLVVTVLLASACSNSSSTSGARDAASSGSGPASSGGTSVHSSIGDASRGPTTSPPILAAPDDGILPGDSLWRTTSEWYRPITDAPVAAVSGEMISALRTWGDNDVFQIDFSFNVLQAVKEAPVTFPPDDEGDNVPVPMPAKGYIEGDHAYDACPGGEDCHILILDPATKKLYEVYQAHRRGSTWRGSVALWKLDKIYPRTNRGPGCTSADAAGLAITPGLVGYRETKKGTIEHALRFIIKNDFIRGVAGDRNTPNVVYPASHGTTAGASVKGIPYGGRLRLKIASDDPRAKSPGAKAILRALKKYGMILADGGNLPLTAESVRVHADANAAETWEGVLAPRDLSFLRPTDFEVVGIPKDRPGGPTAGYFATRAEYEAQLRKPLGCTGITQP